MAEKKAKKKTAKKKTKGRQKPRIKETKQELADQIAALKEQIETLRNSATPEPKARDCTKWQNQPERVSAR